MGWDQMPVEDEQWTDAEGAWGPAADWAGTTGDDADRSVTR